MSLPSNAKWWVVLAATVVTNETVLAAPFVPDDPYFFTDNPVGFPGQWHLDKQTSGALVDVNIRGAWERGLTGQGVMIGIVENGLYYAHPDLAPNYQPELSWDYYTNSYPNLVTGGVAHGTAVAGVAAARGANEIGTTGAAPYAGIANVVHGPAMVNRADAVSHSLLVASALRHRTDAIDIKSLSFNWPWHFDNLAESELALRETTLDGQITVVLAQNYRGNSEAYRSPDVNTRHLTHLPETIVVSGVASDGKFSPYSNFGSNVTVAAPTSHTFPRSDSSIGLFDITTTDTIGEFGYNATIDPPGFGNDQFPDLDYTSLFGGTSSATPLVSGVLALTKEAQPTLDTRFAKHLFARTSRPIDLSDTTPMGGWTTNAAGYRFNNNYGFGLVDADALTLAATQYSGVTPLVTHSTGLLSVGDVSVPENDPMGISQSASLADGGPLEEVQVRLILAHHAGQTAFDDIKGVITSPAGTQSVFFYPSLRYSNHGFQRILDWNFTSNAFWGEDPSGTWTVTLIDLPSDWSSLEDFPAHWLSFEILTRSGSLIPASPMIAGDYDGDLDVDGADYLEWQRQFGLSVTAFSGADGNGNSVVDAADYVIWRKNFGYTSSAVVSPSVAVPEPGSMLLLGLALGFGAAVRRR